MLAFGRFSQKGDTLIEVLFAVTVFSLVAVGSLSIMNQGTTVAQRSLETTLVRQEIDAQAETLRFVHDSYIAAYPNVVSGEPSSRWTDIVAKSQGVVSASTFGTCTPPSGAFIMNTKTATLEGAAKLKSVVPTYSQLRYLPDGTMTAEGIWVEAVQSADAGKTSSKSIDFHIRACWNSTGQAAPMTLGTIVRLYEPL
jgi:type II secretory pathway pseudopilin PulG